MTVHVRLLSQSFLIYIAPSTTMTVHVRVLLQSFLIYIASYAYVKINTIILRSKIYIACLFWRLMENSDGSNFGDGMSVFPIKKFDAMEVLIYCRAGITCLQLPGTFTMSLIVLVKTQMSCYNSIPKYSRMIMCSSLPILYPRAIFTTVMVANLQLDHATKKWLARSNSQEPFCSAQVVT